MGVDGDPDIRARMAALESRVAALEEAAARLSERTAEDVTPRAVDSALRKLGQRVKDGRLNGTYFNARFRQYEVAIADIRMLGSALGSQMAEVNLRPRTTRLPDRLRLKSKLCTQADIESDWALFWMDEMKWPRMYHRKGWELAYIAQAFWAAGKLADGMVGFGFGCGKEPLPSLFAKYGARVLATDLGAADAAAQPWVATNQHSHTVATLRKKSICPDESRLNNIEFRSQDMNSLEDDLFGRFDFCWSACALEHLGSIQNGLSFIRNSLRTLKPGGVAVHTTEFSLVPDDPHYEKGATMLFREEHLVNLAVRLKKEGFEIAEFDLRPGDGILDKFADLDSNYDFSVKQASRLHLKRAYDGFVNTNVGLIITAPT